MGVAVVHLLLLLELHRMKEVCFGRGVGRMLEISLSVVVCVRCLKGVESVMNSIVIVCYVQPLFYIYISYRSMYCMILPSLAQAPRHDIHRGACWYHLLDPSWPSTELIQRELLPPSFHSTLSKN